MEESNEFDKLHLLFFKAIEGSQEQNDILGAMIRGASTFGNWLWVYQSTPWGSECESFALNQMMRLANTLEDSDAKKKKSAHAIRRQRWETIFNECPRGSNIEGIAIKKIVELMKKEKDPSKGPCKL